MTLQAEREESLALVGRAQRIFSAEGEASSATLAEEFELRRRFLEGYATLRRREPERIAALRERVLRYEADLARVGLDPRHLAPAGVPPVSPGRAVAAGLPKLLLLLPGALPGALLHYPAYRVAGSLATRMAEAEDVLATVKVLAAMLFFPLTWILAAVTVARVLGAAAGLASLIVVPLLGYAGLVFFEKLVDWWRAVRALFLFAFRRPTFERLREEGRVIREEILRLGRALGA